MKRKEMEQAIIKFFNGLKIDDDKNPKIKNRKSSL